MAEQGALKGVELQALAAPHESTNSVPARDGDDAILMRLGKKPILKRGFGFMSILGFSCTVLITWEGSLTVCTEALTNGGTAGLIWGFLIAWIGTLSTFASIAELASIAPISGGQYHWIAIMSPPSMKKFLSYVTGWVTVLGWQAINVSNAYLCALLILGTVALTHPEYTPLPWHQLLTTWAVLLFAVLINVISSRALARFEGLILLIHVAGFFGVLVPLVYFGQHNTASVFTTFNNAGGWSSNSLSFLVGYTNLAYSLFGADCAVHMSEEIENAAQAVPQALVVTMGINGSLGFAMMLGLAFTLRSLEGALASVPQYNFAFIGAFLQGVGKPQGAAAMVSVISVMNIFAVVGTVAASTRLLWAFARDRAVPFSTTLSKVSRYSTLPLNTIFTTIMFSVLLSLICLGSSVALNDVLSLSVAGLYSSYLISVAFLFYRRITGAIKPRDDRAVIIGPNNLHWGPWRIPEPFGTINNGFACAFLVFTLFWIFWPTQVDPSPSTMNYSVLVFGGVVLFSVAWYILRARKYYTGPVIELAL